MTRSSVLLVVVVALTACQGSESQTTASQRQLRPGDALGRMKLAKGTEAETDIFQFCDPLTSKRVERKACVVPLVPRLRLGHGWIHRSQARLAEEWATLDWELYLDGRRIDLEAFGVLPDRTYFDAVLDSTVWLRQWNVVLKNATPGRHVLRAVVHAREPFDVNEGKGKSPAGTFVATWDFDVLGG